MKNPCVCLWALVLLLLPLFSVGGCAIEEEKRMGVEEVEKQLGAVSPEEEIKRAFEVTRGELQQGKRPVAVHASVPLSEQRRRVAPHVKALQSADIELRTQAVVRWQQEVDDFWQASQEELRRLVHHSQWQTRMGALLVLEFCYDPAGADIVAEAIKDPEPMVRQTAAEALGMIGGPRAVPLLVEMSSDPDKWVRKSVAAAFSMLERDPAAEKALLTLLKDENNRVREMAAESLALVGSEQCGPALIERLRGDEDGMVRQYAASALGFLQFREAVPALLEGLSDRDEDVRWASARSLGLCAKEGDEKVILALRKVRSEDAPLVRFAAQISLRKLGYRLRVEPKQQS